MATHLLNPTKGRPQKSGGHNPHTTCSPKEHTQRMQDIPNQGRDCQGTTQSKEYNKTSPTGSSQRCRTNLPKTTYHTHHLPKMLPKKPTSSRNDHKHHMTHTPSRSAVHNAATQLPQSTVEETPADMKMARYPQSTSRHLPIAIPKKIRIKEIRQTCS